MALSHAEIEAILHKIGWPDFDKTHTFTDAVEAFQAGWTFGDERGRDLAVDGDVGDNTLFALGECIDNGGKCSPHFTFREFAAHQVNGWILVNRTLVRALEVLRGHFYKKKGLTVISGFRDPKHNPGVRNSQHLFGNGADVPPVATAEQVAALKVFSGIGFNPNNGLVVHVDTRHDATTKAPNPTKSTAKKPAIFKDVPK